MAHEFIDLKGFLFLVLITIPQTLSTNIDCGGKPFHCLNTTHFMICVDLGGGVSSTIDDFIIPCPPTTVCEKNNRFECEFPKIAAFTPDLNVIGESNGYDKTADNKTIPPDKWTTVLSLAEKTTVTELPTKEISMSSLNSEVLENLKDEFTGGNEKIFDEDIVPLSSVVNLKNNTDETSFVSINTEQLITATDKYPHTKNNANTSTNGVVSAPRTDIPTLKDNITFTEESKTINNNNNGNNFNATKNIGQMYVNELNQTINKFIEVGELNTPLPNSSVSIKGIYNLDLDPDNSSSIHQSENLDVQKKIFKTVLITRNVSHITTDTLSTPEKVVATTSKYNATEIVDSLTATMSNSLTSKLNTTATNYSVEPTTEKLRQDDEYSHTLQSVTVNPIEINTTNLNSNTSGKDLPKSKESDISTEGLLILNELDTSNKYTTTNKLDQNNVNELNRTSDKLIKKLHSTTSQDIVDLVNVSEKPELQQNMQNPDLVLVTVSEMTFDTLSTTEPGLVIPKYIGHDNIDDVIESEAMVRNLLPVNANSTASNDVVKSVSEVLKKDDEYKNVPKSVTASPVERSTTYSHLSYYLGTTNANILFAEVPLVTNINRTSNSSDKHETLQKIVTTNLSIKPVKQTVLESLSTSDSNNTLQDSNGFTFKMATPPTLLNNDNKIGFKGDTEIKSKENASIFNDSKIKLGINKTKEDSFQTKTDNMDLKINLNMKPTTNLTHSYISKIATASQTTLMNYNQTSATESPITSADEQSISTGDNNLKSFVENKVQSVPLQESLSYDTPTIENPKTIASPLVYNLTKFDEIYLYIESTTTVDFIQQQSNHMDTKYNESIDLEIGSSLSTITLININETNKTTQNTTRVTPSEVVTYSGDNSNQPDTIIGKESDISSAAAKINETLKTIESHDITFKTSGIRTNSTVDSDANQLPTPSNTAASEQVSKLSKLGNSVNLTPLIRKNDNITLEPLQSVTANIEIHTTTEIDGTTRYPLITESLTESIFSTNMSAETPSSNDIVVSTQTMMEYTKNESTLNDKDGNAIISKSDIYAGLLDSTAKSLFHPLKKSNESNRAPTILVRDVNQDTNLSPNDESKTRNSITKASVVDIIKLETAFDRSKLLTSNVTTKRPPIIVENRILPSTTAEVIQHNTNVFDNARKKIESSDATQSTQEAIAHELDSISTLPTPVAVIAQKQPSINQYTKDELVKVEKQIVNSNIENSTEQIVINDLDSMSTVPTPNETTVERQPNILVTRILASTMTSISQFNMDELAKVETPMKHFNVLNSKSTLPTPMGSTATEAPNITVNRILLNTTGSISQPSTDDLGKVQTRSWSLNITQSTPQKVASYLDHKSMLSIPNENMAKNGSNTTGNRILPSTVASISHPDSDESGKDKMRMESSDVTQSTRQVFVNDSDITATLPSPYESTAMKEPNVTVKQILLSNTAAITQPYKDVLEITIKTPIGIQNISDSTRQTADNNFDSTSVLLTQNDSTAQKEPNISVNRILPSTTTSISLLNKDELDKVQIQVESSNVTQTTLQIVDSNLHNTSKLPTSNKSYTEKEHNITVNLIALNTLAPISQNITDDTVKFGTKIVSSKVTRSSQRIIGNDFDKTSFNIVTEPAAIVETINDTHNIVGRPILSDMILSNAIFINETTNLKRPNKLNDGISKKITEKTTLYNELPKTTSLQNTSSDLNKREDLNFEVKNGTMIDRQINIDLLSSTYDNETSTENYESSTAYNENATLVDMTSLSSHVNKSVSNVGYKSPRSAMDIGRPGYMLKIFSNLTQNITLLNKMYQISNKSNLVTVIHLLASANNKNPPTTINANNEKNTTFTVDCLKLPRGKYADSKDCRKFYICVGKLTPNVGICPNNTVFSEINKQCTRNLSHCVRNNQFHCLYEGRFSDLLRDNIYYICVKNNLNGFLRYKLQCENGYHLNKAKVKCENNEIWNQSDTSVSNSSNVSNNRNRSESNSDSSESSGDGGFECKKEGKFGYPKNCRKYYVCTKNSKDEYRRKIKSCSSEEIYDKKKKKCVSSDSEES